jgi:hypothetical protein
MLAPRSLPTPSLDASTPLPPPRSHLSGRPQVADLVGASRGDIHHLPHVLLKVPALHAVACNSSQGSTPLLLHHVGLQQEQEGSSHKAAAARVRPNGHALVRQGVHTWYTTEYVGVTRVMAGAAISSVDAQRNPTAIGRLHDQGQVRPDVQILLPPPPSPPPGISHGPVRDQWASEAAAPAPAPAPGAPHHAPAAAAAGAAMAAPPSRPVLPARCSGLGCPHGATHPTQQQRRRNCKQTTRSRAHTVSGCRASTMSAAVVILQVSCAQPSWLCCTAKTHMSMKRVAGTHNGHVTSPTLCMLQSPILTSACALTHTGVAHLRHMLSVTFTTQDFALT